MATNLLQNDFITITLIPETGIMEVIYGDLYLLPLQVIKEQIEKTMEVIRAYEIRKVLYNSSKTISKVTAEESKEIARFLYQNLCQTQVCQVARLQSPNYVTDSLVRSNLKDQETSLKPEFSYESFTDRLQAIEWLAGWENLQMT